MNAPWIVAHSHEKLHTSPSAIKTSACFDTGKEIISDGTDMASALRLVYFNTSIALISTGEYFIIYLFVMQLV